MKTELHATIEQLLEIKDGQQNAASLHVRSCECCQLELQALNEINEQLFTVADQQPAPELWQRIQQSVESTGLVNELDPNDTTTHVPLELLAAQAAKQGSAAQHRSLSYAIYTLAASILVTGFIGLYMFSNNLNNRTQNELLQANIQQLMINSRGMEQALQKVSLQSESLTASQRSKADRLYWQLAYLDQMINDTSVDSQPNVERTEVLWNNRIQALRELNQLYYQRQQTLDESEI